MTDRIQSLQTFTRVARSGSFSAAGRELGLSQPSVSRIVAQLEKDVGVALFSRNTRAITLTEAGTDYLARIEPILAALEEADHAARGTGELRGLLRVGAPVSFATREIIPNLPDFMARHPHLRIDFELTDRRQDMINEGIDVAIRVGRLDDTSMVARRLGSSPQIIVASPAYLERVGIPQEPTDLADHITILGPPGRELDGWRFRKDGEDVLVEVKNRLTMSVNEAAVVAALAGLGIATTITCSARAELASGALVRLLPDWEIGSVEVNALLTGGRASKPSARAFVDYLIEVM
ncbi:LysR family transcriptional regulator [Pseudomonas gingeri]|uniref:LysR family transcriptional regulator n=1 Tax=Pseudomonas gingeri TaxID=117681 RepID=UPI0015A19A7D|nr:LysR family transcriptional regulator [Pseudomonas gingeri]NWA24362.1 LysR family transcriptional regulator [Pseudomonas gingeri]